MQVDTDSIKARFPRELAPWEEQRLALLVHDAVQLIRLEFTRRGRDFDREAAGAPWLADAANIAIRHMVNAAILVGGNVGIRSVSSSTGAQADSVTYADVNAVSWGGVALTPDLLALLGLRPAGARGSFPPPRRWPETAVRHGG